MATNPDYTEAVARPRNSGNGGPEGGITMGIPYEAPERGVVAAGEPVTRAGLVWRIVASLVLAAVGINAVVRIVLIMVEPDPAWVAALGMAVIAVIALAYPIVNVVRLVRHRRR